MASNFHLKITGCTSPGAWYAGLIGQVVICFAIDSYGYWTRDTGPLRCSQWIKHEDGEPVTL